MTIVTLQAMSTRPALIVLFLSFLITLLIGANDQIPLLSQINANDRILLLTAHPDDECMFFAPSILAFNTGRPSSHEEREPSNSVASEKSSELFSLCLSTGDADGLGMTRRKELEQSLRILGIPPTNSWVIDNSYVSDNQIHYQTLRAVKTATG